MKGDFFHLVNRGVDKRTVFENENDYLRFIDNLDDFNDTKNIIYNYRERRKKHQLSDRLSDVARPKIQLVDILSWVLIPNHPHIFVQEKINQGKSLFSKKIFGGYTKYFNEKNERSGVLFQGRTKIIKIEKDAHFAHLPFYIMSNALDLIESNWRKQEIKNVQRAVEFLENYKYSSFQDLTGKENFPSALNKQLFFELFDTNEKKFKKDFIEWLGERCF